MICSFNAIRVLSCYKYISLYICLKSYYISLYICLKGYFFLFHLRYGWNVGIVAAIANIESGMSILNSN